MMRGVFVRRRQLQQPPVVPHPAEQRDAHRVAAADETRGHRDLRQPGRRALFAGAGLRSVALQTTLVGVRAGLVGRIQQGIQAMLVLGENSRFRVSVEPLILGLAVWMAAAALGRLKENRHKSKLR